MRKPSGDIAGMANPPNRIRELRDRRGITGVQLAALSGISQSAISRLEKGTRRLKMDQAAAIARALRVSISDLAAEIEPEAAIPPGDLVDLIPNARPAPDAPHPADLMREASGDLVPVYGLASAGPDGRFVINHNDGPIARVPRPPGLTHHVKVFAAQVDGTSMIPWRQPGEVIFAVPGYTPKGCHVLVQIEVGPGEPPEAYVKQLVSRDDDELVLKQYNPERILRFPRRREKEIWRVLEWREVFGM